MNEPTVEEKLAAVQARLEALEQSKPEKRVRHGLSVVAALLLAGVAVGAVPVTLSANTPALASEVMSNFNYLDSRIDALDAGLSTLRGFIAFFPATTCPPGWVPYGPATGRVVVAQTGAAALGVQVSSSGLAPGAQPRHQHRWVEFTTTGEWNSWDVAGAPVLVYDWTNGFTQPAGMGQYPLTRDTLTAQTYYTDPANSFMPYIQLLACQKT